MMLRMLILSVGMGLLVLPGKRANGHVPEHALDLPNSLPLCKLKVWDHSQLYFTSRLEKLDPHLVEFSLIWNYTQINATYSPDLFLPYRWVWTFRTPTENNPYLSWNIDHGLLSFGLLDARTVEVPYVYLEPTNAPCTMELGNRSTTWNIAMALTALVNGTTSENHDINYFCFLSVKPGIKHTTAYTAALYLNFPISYINYNCCVVRYSYTESSYVQDCLEEQIDKWTQCVQMPYLLGLIMFMYFPIILLQTCGWFEQNEDIISQDYSLVDNKDTSRDDANDWVYLDGKPPITLSDAFNSSAFGIARRYPGFISRLRRFCGLVIGPVVLVGQLLIYRHGMGGGKHKISVEQLVKAGTPMGFLALLAPLKDAQDVFAPAFYGPLGLLLIYYLIGLVFIVLPTSVKQIVENGLPHDGKKRTGKEEFSDNQISLPVSPLLLSTRHIFRIATGEMVEQPDPGYLKGATVLKSSFYMIFTSNFWITVWAIQKRRFQTNATSAGYMRCMKFVVFPVIAIVCIVETLVCILYYGMPLLGFVRIMVKGAATSILLIRYRPDGCFSCFFRNPFTIVLGTVLILAMFLTFAYSSCLIFIQSFSFLAKVIIFCFIAVIIYPSVSFGYLFFFVVLIYYLARLIRDFGDGYLEILSTAVEKSVELDNQVNSVTTYDDTLTISNVKVTNVTKIRINGSVLNIPQNALQIQNDTRAALKTTKRGHCYGIPRQLFDQLVRKYRPVHVQVLKLFFHLLSIFFLIAMTISITSKVVSGTSSEISDVMHVIFIVTVGALPRVLEVVISNESVVVKKEIEARDIEQSILKYWHQFAEEHYI